MANHMMIDLETLDTRPTGVVFQVGVICFADVLYGEPDAWESDLEQFDSYEQASAFFDKKELAE